MAERLVDVVALVMLGSFALGATGLTSAPLQKALMAMTVFGGFGLVIMLMLPRFGCRMEKILFALPMLDDALKARLAGLLQQFLRGLRALLNIRRATGFGLLTLLIWLMDGLGTILGGFILNLHFTLLQALVLLAGLGLSSALPATPGYVGIYQFVAMLVLVPFGFSNAEAVAYILFAQVNGFLLVSAWGALGLWNASPPPTLID
jgi:uncharacterized membrane protein YbhN (UPF0104 family)